MKITHHKPPLIRTSVRLTFISLVLLVSLLLPFGVQAINAADGSITLTPTSQPAATKTLKPTRQPQKSTPKTSKVSWLSNTTSAAKLATSQSLALLAGEMIFHGLVDASGSCNGGSGMLENGYASPCGEKAARKAVIVWQNQYNQEIFEASSRYEVPPYLLKNIITQESQFWPAQHLTDYGYYEFGLGHITQMGADTLLRWNKDYFDQLCPQVYTSQTCETDYGWMPTNQQAMLRGKVLQTLNAECGSCEGGIKLSRAHASISTIAAAVQANHNHIEWTLAGILPGGSAKVADNSTLWRLSLASYNAGPGCVTSAIRQVNTLRLQLTWENFTTQLDPACSGAVTYVDKVTVDPSLADSQVLASAMTDNSLGSRLVYASLGIPSQTPLPPPEINPTDPGLTATLTAASTIDPSLVTMEATLTGTLNPETPTPEMTPGVEFTSTPNPPEATPTGTLTPDLPTPTAAPSVDITLTTTLPVSTPTPTLTEEIPLPSATASVETSPTSIPFETTTPAILLTESSTPTTTPTIDITLTSLTPEITATPTILADTATLTPTQTIAPTQTPETPDPQLQSPHVKNQLLVKINQNKLTAAIDTLNSLGINLSISSDKIDTLNTLVIDVAPEKLDETLKVLKKSEGIEFAEPNFLAKLASLPNDPDLALQNGLNDMQVPQTWDALTSMQDVVVAVVDTGVDASHPDLVDRIWINAGEVGRDSNGHDKSSNAIDDDQNGYVDDWQGWNTVSGNNDTSDTQGHGTHLAGIIGASVNNSIGIAGVAPNARILPVKVLDNSGFGTYAQISEGIVYATDMGARIINLGFGGVGSSELLQNAIDYATSHNVLVVAASGNGGTNTPFYPAAYPGVIAVSALSNNLSWAPFSSSGDHISLSAPGEDIYSLTPGGGYSSRSGSSQASANVSGVAALLASQPQFADVNTLRSALLGSALDLGSTGRDPFFGYGAVRAYSALGYVGPILPTPTPGVLLTPSTDGVYVQSLEMLYSTHQIARYAFSQPDTYSIDGVFNDLTTSSTGPYGASSDRSWTFDTFRINGNLTSITVIDKVILDFRFYMTDWQNDIYYIQLQEPQPLNPVCGASGWCTVRIIETPPTALTTVSIDLSSLLNTPARVNAAQVRIAGAAVTNGATDIVTIFVDGVRLQVSDQAQGPTSTPTPTFTPTPLSVPTSTLPASRAPTAAPQANEPHNNFNMANTDLCAGCHRSHTSQSVPLVSQSTEKQLCMVCHSGGGSGTNIQPAFVDNTATSFFSHPVSASPNLHNPSENSGSSFGGASRHIECSDCHAPHSSSRVQPLTSNTAPGIQQEMYGSTGVQPIYTAAGSPNGFSWLSKADREYQVCFKCHSSFTTLPSYSPAGLNKITAADPAQVQDSRDLSKEFNPFQASFHPVTSLGRNREIPSGSFVPGWSVNSIVYCTDCHTNGSGPHGSTDLHMLDGAADGALCYKCHQSGTYSTGSNSFSTTHFKKEAKNLHSFHVSDSISCYSCHDTHGSEQARLINFDTTEVDILPGYTSQNAWSIDPITGTGSCAISCHGEDHSQLNYTP